MELKSSCAVTVKRTPERLGTEKKHKKSVKYAIHNAVYCLYVEMIILWIAALNSLLLKSI